LDKKNKILTYLNFNNNSTELSLGICIGASNISYVISQKDDNDIKVCLSDVINHQGNPKKELEHFFKNLLNKNISIITTGRKFKDLLNADSIPEPKAIENAVEFLGYKGKSFSIASLGAENFMIYCLNKNGNIQNVLTGNKCASGTGEFFMQQIGRMNLTVEEAVDISDIDSPYSVSGRCSVFCKSDCTHALNKGIDKSRVSAGLSKMLSNKTIELLSKQNNQSILLIGGVSQNNAVFQFIKRAYPDTIIPDYSICFEALGASLEGHKRKSKFDKFNIFKTHSFQFSFFEPLENSKAKVEFKSIIKSEAKQDDVCILGIDVGSTTTKAVLLRVSDNAILASIYLRTNGNPIKASVECYTELKNQIKTDIKIIGLGATGSGRHIAALHSLYGGDVNEIIAHSVAAAFFDKDVDTIFEIGGQDAKYTHLTNGIASDYAMNEACSAGTGSFLEESAKESLNIKVTEIETEAFKSKSPINFNDQCAAFISSDIKNAGSEGAKREDIIAGLVYSVCLNYVNRVKGNRPVGNKVFMQGGVCYNKAVPFAMSLLIGKEIIVPPEPGLMGAFGVALEIKKRISLGLYKENDIKLDELINRKFEYKKSFECAGGKEKCDLKCAINIIEIEDKKYPFGGACNKYYNERHNFNSDTSENNIVKLRERLIFNDYLIEKKKGKIKIGVSKSLLTNTLYPFYFNFFTGCGFEVVLSDEIDKKGLDKIRSSYCYPVEISHGYFRNLLTKNTDYIFLPHIMQMDGREINDYNRMCVFVQGETYFLQSSFRDEIEKEYKIKILSPILDFSKGIENSKDVFVKMVTKIGCDSTQATNSFDAAIHTYKNIKNDFKSIGRDFLKNLRDNPDEIAFVLFGRPYNAFTSDVNLNVPNKIATRGYKIIPFDFLPFEEFRSYENMYWYSGNENLSAARFVKEHPQLFGVFITNFSCGPDSFIIPYFRKIMGDKPSLTLELDSHSADVGVETRIEAAIDIIKNYLNIDKDSNEFKPDEKNNLKIINKKNKLYVKDYKGNIFPIHSEDIEVVIPSMGRYSSDVFAAVLRSMGIQSRPLPVPTFETLTLGRGVATCKECLPFLLTTGSLLEYIKNLKAPNKKVLFFMPHGYGPCRQGQYHVRLKDILKSAGLVDSGIMSMDDESSFEDFGNGFFIKQWLGMMIADVYHDIENALNVLAYDNDDAHQILNTEWELIISKLEKQNFKEVYKQLASTAERLSQIKLKNDFEEAKFISLVGEIYVRREEYSRIDLIKILNENGFIVRTAPITEYVYYTNHLQKKGIVKSLNVKDKISLLIKEKIQIRIEKKIKSILSKSGLYNYELIDVEETIKYGKDLVSDYLIGESILTVGLSLREILNESCGIITIGPFNCIPSRLAEGILNKEMTLEGKYRFGKLKRNGYPDTVSNLPYLHVETDGNPFPQITQSRLEIFMMQANKLHYEMDIVKKKHEK